jgi:hypothetical protein
LLIYPSVRRARTRDHSDAWCELCFVEEAIGVIIDEPSNTIEELRAALVELARRYNETWLVARHGYRTPTQVRADQSRLDPNTTADLKLAA